MNPRPALLLCAALATLAPCSAQTADSALQARLRARIMELSPKLTFDGAYPEQDDELALPLAQLGDEAAAKRLASTPNERDEIWQWRTQQRALRGDWDSAMQAAQSVKSAPVRADGLLVVARLARDKGDFAAARAALTRAMPTLTEAPASNQLAYAAWLWWRVGDVAAARRIFIDQAWAAALREDEADAKQWQRAVSPLPLSKRQTVIEFSARCGLLSDLLRRFDPNNKLSAQWMIGNVSAPSDLQFLFERAIADKTAEPAALYAVAIALAQSGDLAKARQLRERAQANQAAEESGYASMLQLTLAAELGDAQTVAEIAESWRKLGADKRASQELAGLPELARAFRSGVGHTSRLRADAPRAVVDNYTEVLLQQPNLLLTFGQTLPALLEYYAPRAPEKARALVTALTAQIAVADASKDNWSWNASLAAIAAQQRDAGHTDMAARIVDAVVAHTPEIFRPAQAVAFMEAGFPEAARQTFDPLQRLRQEQDLAKSIEATKDQKQKEQLQHQQKFLDWGSYAENEARYLAPDAPAVWFDAMEAPQQRIKVLQGWVNGLSPQLKLAPPYVKYTLYSGGYGVTTSSSF